MSNFKATATAVSPYVWPMDADASFGNKTSDEYAIDTTKAVIPSLWSSTSPTFDIVISGNATAPDEVTVTGVTLATAPTGESLTVTKTGAATFRVTGSVGPQTGEYYNFKMRDLSVKQLAPNNTEDWMAVTKWNAPPRPWYRTITYVFDVTYDATIELLPVTGQTESYTVTQYIYWSWESGLATLQTLAIQGEK